MDIRRVFTAVLLTVAFSSLASAEEAVQIGGAYALLNKPASPQAVVILIPGGDGQMNIRSNGSFSALGRNQLVRTRKAYLGHGVATLTIDRGVTVASAVDYARKTAPKVVIAGTSRGSLRVHQGLSARPNGIAVTAAFLPRVSSNIGSPTAAPPILVVQHRRDGCRHTLPGNVEPFQAWGGAKVKVVWLDGGTNVGSPCEAEAYHGFNGLDGKVVSAVANFAKSVK